uniref:GPN-loop GTPase 2 n=1 Tax=Globodera rostochiensis TaxID=31243 RepID=A0A914H3S7_GLORO
MTDFYGQLVIGAPGSGKSTYCAGLQQFFHNMKRPHVMINLDPANERLPFDPHIDIRELITVEDVMEKFRLGPNGALRYCMQTLATNITWLRERIEKFRGFYLVIDMPGQLELYCSEDSIKRIVAQFSSWGWHICAVHLSDSTYANDPGKFVSVLLSALSAMVNLEVSQINVLSKVDLLPDSAPFRLEYFEELPNLKHLTDCLNDHPALSLYKKLNKSFCEMIESYGMVNFVSLDVQDKDRMSFLLRLADNANGFNLANVEDFRKAMKMRGIGVEVTGTSPIIALMSLFCHLANAANSDVDNGVLGTPEVLCGRDFVHFRVVTKKPFGGRVYVKGEFGNPKCVENVGTRRGEAGTGHEAVGGREAARKAEFDESIRNSPQSSQRKEGSKVKEEVQGEGILRQSTWKAAGAVPEGEEEEEEGSLAEGVGGGRIGHMTAEEEADEETLRQFLLELQKRHNNNTNGSQRTIPSHLPGFGSADQLKRWRSFLKGKPGLDGQGFRRYGSRLSPDANGECPLICPPCEELEDKERMPKGISAKGRRQRRLADEHSAELRVPLGECNTRRDRMANPPGMQVSFTIVVSFHSNFITRVDRAYNIQCAYQEPERLLSAQIDVSSPPIIQISNQMEAPQCEYRIHGQSSADQVLNVRVGDMVEHEWLCHGREMDFQSDSSSGERMAQMFGLLVHDCFVDDGKSRREKVVDSKGCSKDPLILPTPKYSPNSLRASILSSVAKFPDGDLVGFQCSITVCMRDLGKCDGFTPPNCSENGPFGSNMTVFDLAEGAEEATGDGLYAKEKARFRQPLYAAWHNLPKPSAGRIPTGHSFSQMCVSLPLFALLISASTFLVTVSAGTLFVTLIFRDSLSPNGTKH